MENNSQDFLEINRDWNLLYPPFADKVQKAIDALEKDGVNIGMFEGWRSPTRQSQLFLKDTNKVTKVSGWLSWHQYGLAADIAYRDDNDNWTWDRDFNTIHEYFTDRDLHWGGPGDAGHYSWPMKITCAEALTLVQAEGLQALWLRAKL